MSISEKFYSRYGATHAIPRKGRPTLAEFERRATVYRRQFNAFLPKARDASIIDLGCGNGSVVWWLAKCGYKNVTGVDLAEDQIAIGRELGVRGLEVGDLMAALQTGIRRDCVIARDVLEHFEKPKVVELLTLIRSSLNPGGVLILQVPNAESPFFGRIRYGDFTHQLAFTSSSLSQVLRVAGFARFTIRGLPPSSFDLKSAIRMPFWKASEILYRLLLATEGGGFSRIVTPNIGAAAWVEA